jgi:hypothetical protein
MSRKTAVGSATWNGQLFRFGGGDLTAVAGGNFYNSVQIYQRRLISALSLVVRINSGKLSGKGSRRRKLSVAARKRIEAAHDGQRSGRRRRPRIIQNILIDAWCQQFRSSLEEVVTCCEFERKPIFLLPFQLAMCGPLQLRARTVLPPLLNIQSHLVHSHSA